MALVDRYRANKGAINDLLDAAYEHYKAHGRDSWADAFREAAADKVLQRYEDKIRNGFRRAGLELPEGELTQEVMLGVVRDQTGLEVGNLDPDAVMAAVDKLLSARLSTALGVTVGTVMDRDALVAAVNGAVVEAIKSGRASAWINSKAYSAARKYVAYKNRGFDHDSAEKISNRQRQKRYRENHKLKWI